MRRIQQKPERSVLGLGSTENRRLLSGQLCFDRPEAGRKDVIADLRDHRVTIGTNHFKIGPPFPKRPIAFSDSMQSDSGHTAANGQRALDNLVSKRVVPVIHAKQTLAHILHPMSLKSRMTFHTFSTGASITSLMYTVFAMLALSARSEFA